MAETQVIQIYVGPPEDDAKVTVNTGQTVSEVFAANDINLTGMIQLNGRTLSTRDLNKTLDKLNVVDGDSLHVVRKMDGAQG